MDMPNQPPAAPKGILKPASAPKPEKPVQAQADDKAERVARIKMAEPTTSLEVEIPRASDAARDDRAEQREQAKTDREAQDKEAAQAAAQQAAAPVPAQDEVIVISDDEQAPAPAQDEVIVIDD
jgi:protein TonB